MKKDKPWFLRHKVISIFLVLLLFVIPLIAVNILFKLETDVWFLQAEWSAGDILGYIAGFEAFIGTLLLGVAALKQSDRANEINDRLMQMQEESQRFEIREKAAPIAVIPQTADQKKQSYVINDDDSDEYDVLNQKFEYVFFTESPSITRENYKLFNMVIELVNISNAIIKEIELSNFRLFDILTNTSGVSPEKENITEYIYNENNAETTVKCMLRPGESVKICLKIGMDGYDLSKESFCVNFDLSTVSIYNVRFTENVGMLRNNVVDEKDRVYISEDQRSFASVPDAAE